MMADAQARAVVAKAFDSGEIAPSAAELQAVQAIGRFEGVYGAWGPGKASNNWGAVQAGAPPCGANAFEHEDTHADGTPYVACFRIYASPEAGAADLIRELYRRPGVPEALAAGDATQIAERMHESGYFEAKPASYARAIETHAAKIAESLNEPLLVKRGGGAVGPVTTSQSTPIVVALGLAAAGFVLLRRAG